MIDNASFSPKSVSATQLTVVPKTRGQKNGFPRKHAYLFFKRVFDIICSISIILGVLSWLYPIIGLLIRLSSKGPVLFRQKRIGRGGKTFTCFKFRTMHLNEEADYQQASADDKRIIGLGKFLRKSNLDELPQFFNILSGEMSVVGPRPHMHSDCNRFALQLQGYKFRNLVKPGLTGLAQIKGFHGPTPTNTTIFMRFYWDQYYVKNRGWYLDTKILLSTFFQKILFLNFFFSPRKKSLLGKTTPAI